MYKYFQNKLRKRANTLILLVLGSFLCMHGFEFWPLFYPKHSKFVIFSVLRKGGTKAFRGPREILPACRVPRSSPQIRPVQRAHRSIPNSQRSTVGRVLFFGRAKSRFHPQV